MNGPRQSCLLAGALAAALMLACAGCRSAPPAPPGPLVPPEAKFLPRQSTGSPLASFLDRKLRTSPPAAAAKDALEVDPLRVKVDLFAIDGLRASGGAGFEPLASRARLILGLRGSDPILPSPQLLAGSLVGPGHALGSIDVKEDARLAFIGSWTGVLTPGQTWAIEAGDPERGPVLPGGERAWRHLEILVHRIPLGQAGDRAKGIEVAIGKEEEGSTEPPTSHADEPKGMGAEAMAPDSPASAPAPVARSAPAREIQREAVLLDGLPEKGPGQLAVLIPFRFEGGSGDTVAALITVDEPPPGSMDAFRESAVAMTHLSYQESPAQKAGLDVAPISPEELELRAALASLRSAPLRRRALAYLSGMTGAALCEDLSLSAGDDVLSRIALKIGDETSAPGAVLNPAALGFSLEKSGFEVLAELLAEEMIPAELNAVLVLHSGEAGRDAASIEEVLRASAGKEDLERRLLDENLICLDDASPSSRVRALDWLRARNQAPEGFDPLAPLKERRKALEKAMAAKEAMPVKTEGKPQ